jgi:hypothetical protein
LVLGSEVPFRVQTYETRKARQERMQAPADTLDRPDLGTIPKRDLAYFAVHGLYPPHWRPLEQRASDWGTVAAKKSWENRKFDPIVLLGLEPGRTTKEQVLALKAKEIMVSVAKVERWRRRLIEEGIVTPGEEPWHTSTTTRKAGSSTRAAGTIAKS